MISILLSAYNGGKYIIEQLDSLKNQSMKADEVVIIDDNSSDNTYKLCKNYIDDNNLVNWMIIKNDINKGWQFNFHYGINYTKGDYIFYCDQDDIWLNDKIETSMKILNANTNLNVLATNEKKIFNDGTYEYLYKNKKFVEIIDVQKHPKDVFIRCSGCSMVVKRSFLDKINKYYVEGYAHDAMAWNFASIDNSLGLSHSYTILHRIHGGNVTVKKHNNLLLRKQSCSNSIKIYETILSYLNDCYCDKIKTIKIYKRFLKSEKVRLEFLNNHKVKYIFYLIFNHKYLYRRPRQLFGDIYYSIFKNKEVK